MSWITKCKHYVPFGLGASQVLQSTPPTLASEAAAIYLTDAHPMHHRAGLVGIAKAVLRYKGSASCEYLIPHSFK